MRAEKFEYFGNYGCIKINVEKIFTYLGCVERKIVAGETSAVALAAKQLSRNI